MAIHSELPGYSTAEARRALEGLPRCDYDVVIKPLRYRWAPHLAALCEFDERRIVLQVPVPFHAFKEPVIYAARRSLSDPPDPSPQAVALIPRRLRARAFVEPHKTPVRGAPYRLLSPRRVRET